MSKIAIVTGGAGDIGAEICKMIIHNLSVDKVYSFDTILDNNPYTTSMVVDVTDRKDVARATMGLNADILINAAGITKDSFLHKMSERDWDRVLDVNLTGAFNVTRSVIKGMREREWGRIVNISSVNGTRGQMGQCNYSASKAGLHGFTMSLAQESAIKSIMVNTVSPGYIDTQMTQKIDPNVRSGIISTIPMKYMGTPADVAYAVEFLISSQNKYITGANIPVNGGLHVGF